MLAWLLPPQAGVSCGVEKRGALAAYAARAGAPAHVYMPQDAPLINILEVQMMGSDLHLVNGLINDAGREAAEAAAEGGWFDVSTLKEPYRIEGKKCAKSGYNKNTPSDHNDRWG